MDAKIFWVPVRVMEPYRPSIPSPPPRLFCAWRGGSSKTIGSPLFTQYRHSLSQNKLRTHLNIFDTIAINNNAPRWTAWRCTGLAEWDPRGRPLQGPLSRPSSFPVNDSPQCSSTEMLKLGKYASVHCPACKHAPSPLALITCRIRWLPDFELRVFGLRPRRSAPRAKIESASLARREGASHPLGGHHLLEVQTYQ